MARAQGGAASVDGVVLKEYYEGDGMRCPVQCGERAEVVRVGSTEEGGGVLWVECRSCAQRESYEVPKATASERREVGEMAETGHEPSCPRHNRPVTLTRLGRRLVCPDCGVSYRD